jgi:RHS repeat-associated protein
VTGHKQTTDGTAYTTGYTYDLAGNLLEETYPSTRVVKNVLDNNGDLAMVESKKTSSAGYWAYANSFTYNAAGAVTALQLGNGHWESTTFNSRLQPTQIALGVLPDQTNLLKLNFGYGTTANNGNVLSQTITVPNSPGQDNNAFTANQVYTYDELNRIKDATETVTGVSGNAWKQTFVYDRYGNRRFDFANGNTTVPAANCSEPVCNPTISTSNNRLTSTGWLYDNGGNTTRDGSYNTFTYDGENKQVLVKNSSSVTLGEYWYDGDGKRLKKKGYDSSGNLTEQTIFVYDATGRSIAEYSTEIASIEQAKVAYLTSDHLGSPRINTDANGAVVARHDYHPFGEEITTSQRTYHPEYGGDAVRKQFTGYERDYESNFDFAEARYHDYGRGRFSSPDPLASSASPVLPETWNRYVYSLNNPLRFVDPTGMSPGDYYDLKGNKIGTDGQDDKKIYIVYDNDKAKEIKNTKGDYTAAVDAKISIPNADVIAAVGDAVKRSDAATYKTSPFPKLKANEDAKGGFREVGLTAKTTNGKTEISTVDGAYADPRVEREAAVSMPTEADLKARVHPSGIIEETSGQVRTSTTGATIGTSGSVKTSDFNQPVSQGDMRNASRSGTNLVVAAQTRQVYFYNNSRTYAQMSLNNFLKIGR